MHRFLVLFLCLYCVRASTVDGSGGLYRPTRSTDETCEPISPALTSSKSGQKAWDKCVEYQEQLIYPCEKGGTRLNKCNHNVDELISRDEAYPNEFPHMALLGSGEYPKISWQCNGALISDRFILAAGHCSTNREAGPNNIAALGALKIEDFQPSNLHRISEIIRHPSFKPPTKYNDIALFKLETPITLDQTVVPACLNVGDQADYRTGVHTGWNLRDDTKVLRTVDFEKFSDDECKASVTKPIRILKQGINTTTQLCFGVKSSDSRYTCQADGGGPIQIRSRKISCMYVLIGVASFCSSHSRSGDVYTGVASYVPWIESIVWPDTE